MQVATFIGVARTRRPLRLSALRPLGSAEADANLGNGLAELGCNRVARTIFRVVIAGLDPAIQRPSIR
jgi:hypothetical protein